MKITKNDFPKKIYVYVERYDEGEGALYAERTPEECIRSNSELLATYVLEKVSKVTKTVVLEDV